jgi:hypothetical protein
MTLMLAGGGDFDLGWRGDGHNDASAAGPVMIACLQGCDLDTDPICVGTGPTGEGTINGEGLGPPQPARVGGFPFCLASEFVGEIAVRKLDLQTGAVDMRVHLETSAFLTNDLDQPCPTCTGESLGATGACVGGPGDGNACTTDGLNGDLGNTSNDCPPFAVDRRGKVTVVLDPLTSGNATLHATLPCQGGLCACAGQVSVNGCVEGSSCEAANCPSAGVASGALAGIDQGCCESDTGVVGCFPGDVVRSGSAVPLAPPWPEPSYPKGATDVTLAASICVPATNRGEVDIPAGLPGPAAVILPVELLVESKPGPPAPPPTTTTTTVVPTTSTTTTTLS